MKRIIKKEINESKNINDIFDVLKKYCLTKKSFNGKFINLSDIIRCQLNFSDGGVRVYYVYDVSYEKSNNTLIMHCDDSKDSLTYDEFFNIMNKNGIHSKDIKNILCKEHTFKSHIDKLFKCIDFTLDSNNLGEFLFEEIDYGNEENSSIRFFN